MLRVISGDHENTQLPTLPPRRWWWMCTRTFALSALPTCPSILCEGAVAVSWITTHTCIQVTVSELHSCSGHSCTNSFDSERTVHPIQGFQVTNCAIICELAIWLSLPTFRQRLLEPVYFHQTLSPLAVGSGDETRCLPVYLKGIRTLHKIHAPYEPHRITPSLQDTKYNCGIQAHVCMHAHKHIHTSQTNVVQIYISYKENHTYSQQDVLITHKCQK